MDFQNLKYQERFDELCKQLLLKKYPTLNTVNGRGGDQGTDSFIGTIDNQVCVFQFKYFLPKLTVQHWQKIRDSVKTSYEKNKPDKWVLLLPIEFTTYDWEKWQNLQEQYPDMKFDLLGSQQLQTMISEDETLIFRFPELFPQVELITKTMEAQKRQIERQQMEALTPSASTVTSTNVMEESAVPILDKYNEKFLQLSIDEQRQVDECLKKFNETIRDVGGSTLTIEQINIKSVTKLAIYYHRNENYERALFLYDLILREYKDDLRSLNNKAVLYFDKNEYEQALRLIDSALEINPDYYDAKVNKAAAMLELDRNEEGIQLLDKLYEERQDDDVVLRNFILAYSKVGNVSKMEEYYRKAETLISDNEFLIGSIGLAYLNARTYDKAIAMFDSVLRLNPNNTKVGVNKAIAFIELGLDLLGIALLEKILKIEPKNRFAMTNMAYANIRLRRYDLAVVWGSRSLEVKSADLTTLNTVGISFVGLGDYEEGIKYYDRALKIRPNYLNALANKSVALILSNRIKEALECMEEYLKYDPNDATILYNRKQALRRISEEQGQDKEQDVRKP